MSYVSEEIHTRTRLIVVALFTALRCRCQFADFISRPRCNRPEYTHSPRPDYTPRLCTLWTGEYFQYIICIKPILYTYNITPTDGKNEYQSKGQANPNPNPVLWPNQGTLRLGSTLTARRLNEFLQKKTVWTQTCVKLSAQRIKLKQNRLETVLKQFWNRFVSV